MLQVVSNPVQAVPHAIEMRSVGQVAVKLAPGASVAPPAVTLADLALIDVPVEVPRSGGGNSKNGGKKPSGRRRQRRRLRAAVPSELLQLPAALNAVSAGASPLPQQRQRRELFAAGPPPPAPASPAPAPGPSSSSSSAVAPGCDVPSGYVYTVSGAQHVTVNLTLTLAASAVTSASQMLQSAADGGAMISGFAQAGLSVEKVQILLLRDLAAGGAAADVVLGGPVQVPQLPAPLAPLANASSAGGARPGEVGVQPGAIAGILAAAVAGTATAVAVVYKLSTRKRRRRGGKLGAGASGGANGDGSGAAVLDDDELDIEAVKAGIGLPPSMGKAGVGPHGGNNAMHQSSNSLLDRDPALRLLNNRAAAAAAAAANGGSDDSGLLHGASTDDSALALRGGVGASGALSDFGGGNNNRSAALASAGQVNNAINTGTNALAYYLGNKKVA